ncbi:MAG: response regulator transcription factor [Chloroflexota bacterium]
MNEKILVIEDDPSALRFIAYTLEHEGYQVLSAKDGLEGIKKARDEHPSLIVLDIMLPGLDGYALCQQLRQKPETSLLPILILSAKARQDDKDIGLRMGADDYLTKPADPLVIIAKVKTLLAGTSQIISTSPGIEKSQS